jgi:hypothetical protein
VTELVATQTAIPSDDLQIVQNIPDLRVADVVEVTRENYGTGYEYGQRQVIEGIVSCEPFRSLARARLSELSDAAATRRDDLQMRRPE